MKISYAITVCNELNEIQRLLKLLLAFKRSEDEIVVLFDSTNFVLLQCKFSFWIEAIGNDIIILLFVKYFILLLFK